MQEDVDRKLVVLSVNATKLTARVLAMAVKAAMRKMQKEYQKSKTPKGKQSYKKLMNHSGEKKCMPLDGETRLWDKVAREHKVDYAFYPNGPGKYLLFFKAAQADSITTAFSEYTKAAMSKPKSRHPSIYTQLEKCGEMARNNKPKEIERKREAVLSER